MRLKIKNPLFKENVLISAVLLGLLAIFFFDIVFLNKTFKVTTANPQALITGVYGQAHNKPPYFIVQSNDVSYIEEPIQAFIKQSLAKGQFPLWNPHQACGYALIGMMHLGLFWPLNIIMRLLPDPFAWDFLILSRIFLAGFLTYGFMRTLRYDRIISLTTGVIYMLSGPMLIIQFRYANVEILLPLILLTLERLLRQPDRIRCGCVSAAVFLTFLAGDPEHIFLVNTFGFAYFLFRLVSIRPRIGRAKALGFLTGAYILAGGLSAFVLFPFLRNWFTEIWHNHPPNVGVMARGQGLLKSTLVNLILPRFFQPGPLSLSFERWTWMGHAGLIPVVMACISLFSRQRQKLNLFFMVSATLLFAKSYVSSPLINWIGYLPLFSMVRFFFHTPHLICFCLAIAAGMGMRFLASGTRALRPAVLTAACFAFLISLALWEFRAIAAFKSMALPAAGLGAGLLTIFLAGLILKQKQIITHKGFLLFVFLLISVEMGIHIPRPHVHRFDSFPRVPYIDFIKKVPERIRSYGVYWTFYPNTATGYQIDDLGIVHGILPKRFVRFVNQFLIRDFFKQDTNRSALWVVPLPFSGSKPYLDMLNVAFTIAPKNLGAFFPAARSPNFPETISLPAVDIFVNRQAFARCFIAHRVIFETQEENVFKLILKNKNQLKTTAIIHHQTRPDIKHQLESVPAADGSAASIVRYTPNEVIVKADMQHPGFLILSDSYHPDWKAWVDGKPSQIFITHYLIRSVFLDTGLHTVRFRFVPWSFYGGIAVSLLSGLILAVMLRRRPKPS